MINAVCPNSRCSRSLPVESRFLGRKITCPHCQQAFLVETAPSPQSTSADPEATTTPWLPGSEPPGTVPRAPAPAARRTTPPAPAAGGPPPLPPLSGGRALRTGPLVVSVLSLLVTLSSCIGIVNLVRSPEDGVAGEGAPVAPGPPPVERWAAITIESGGVRLVVIDAKKTPGNPDLILVHATNRDWNLRNLPPGVPTRPEHFDELERILGKFNEEFATNNVPADHRLVACNGGVLSAGGDAGREKIKGWVQESVRKALGREVEFVDTAAEAEYGARGSIPPTTAVRARSVTLDMGNSATKYGYFDTPTTFKGDALKLGMRDATSGITAVASAKKISFATAAREWKATADREVRKVADGTPQLMNHERYYLLGGTPWVVTVIAHPEEFAKPVDARAVDIRLSPVDIEGALRLIEEKNDVPALTAAVATKVPAGPARENLEAELTGFNRFNLQQLLAGATLLKSISDGCNFSGKEVRFYTRSLHAWPVGYILVKGKFEQ
jgi:hypothetical protein